MNSQPQDPTEDPIEERFDVTDPRNGGIYVDLRDPTPRVMQEDAQDDGPDVFFPNDNKPIDGEDDPVDAAELAGHENIP